jgi:hypothetical protein
MDIYFARPTGTTLGVPTDAFETGATGSGFSSASIYFALESVQFQVENRRDLMVQKTTTNKIVRYGAGDAKDRVKCGGLSPGYIPPRVVKSRR